MTVLSNSSVDGVFVSMLTDPPSTNSEDLLKGSFSFCIGPDFRVDAIVSFILRSHELELENSHNRTISLNKTQSQKSREVLRHEFEQTFPNREFPRVPIPRNIYSGSMVIQENVRNDLKPMYGAG